MALSLLGELHHDLARLNPPVQFPLSRPCIPHPYECPSSVIHSESSDHVPSKQSLNRHHFLATAGPIAIPRRRPHTRSLTASMGIASMIMHEDTAPSSPPDLTDSRSSKSSSYNSSILSDSTAEDINHFEDIALEDVQEPIQPEIYDTRRRSTGKRASPPRSMAQTSPNARGATHTASGIRDLTNSSRPQYPSLKGQVNGAINNHSSLGLPNGKQMRRGFTSPSSPSLPTMIRSGTRSRSPSPTPTNQMNSSSRALPPRRIRTHSPGQRFATRRQSWQPSRKSVKELEAEYHDSDEEVPEDAVIHNVPLSPGISQRSATPSPERPSQPAQVNHDARVKGKRPSAPSNTAQSREPLPHSTAEPSSSRSLPPVVSENMPTFPPTRSKSWNIAMSDLSKEAQELSIALETHAEELTLSRRPSYAISENQENLNDLTLHRAKTASTVELPPVRKGNIMIDPLPISKEKEAVLTRTRPSWLPPKSQKEEKRHLKEYQKMMAQSAELDRRKAAKVEAAQQLLVEQRGTMDKIWETHVLPNWGQVINERKTRELWWKGVATKSRGEVWQRALGNELGLNDSSYEKALARANAREKDLQAAGEGEAAKRKECEWFKAIRRDAATAFPELRIFQQGGPLYEDLVKVLMAYAMYRNDVGYVYGTHVSPVPFST